MSAVSTPQDFARSLIAVSVLAAILNVSLLAIAKKARLTFTPSNLFIFNLCLCDIIIVSANIPFTISIANSPRDRNLLATSTFFCNLNGFFNKFMALSTVLTLVALALERYIQVCTNRKLTLSCSLKCLAVMQLIIIAVSIKPFFTETGYEIQPSQVYCMEDLTSDRFDVRVARIVMVVGLNASFLVVMFCYLMIFFRVRKIENQLETSTAPREEIIENFGNMSQTQSISTGEEVSSELRIAIPSQNHTSYSPSPDSPTSVTSETPLHSTLGRRNSCSKDKKFCQIQKTILLRAVSICLTFTVCWSVYDYNLIYTAITRKPVSVYMDSWGLYLIALHGILNPLLLLAVDTRFREPIEKFIFRLF